MVLYQLGKLTVSICVNFVLQKKEAERPKVEVVQEEEEVVHEDNEWGERQLFQLAVSDLQQFAWICNCTTFYISSCVLTHTFVLCRY